MHYFQQLDITDCGASLIPGITAEARIITDRTTVLRMVLRKLDFIN